MTDDERKTKERLTALRTYMVLFNETFIEDDLTDEDIIDRFHFVLHADMEVVSKQLCWEDPAPDEVSH